MRWQYGLTTVPSRRENFLRLTIQSLAKAGFDKPRLFVDGCCDIQPYLADFPQCEITVRDPQMSILGNWYLGMLEMYLRDHKADRYAMFQDDIIAVSNLRTYLESCEYPKGGYCNLYTMPVNLLLSGGKQGWYRSNQKGFGALALVFTREAITTLLSQKHLVDRVQVRGHKSVDGAIVTAMKHANYCEYVHSPSLVQHLGRGSTTLGNRNWPDADSFPGENFDAVTLLER